MTDSDENYHFTAIYKGKEGETMKDISYKFHVDKKKDPLEILYFEFGETQPSQISPENLEEGKKYKMVGPVGDRRLYAILRLIE